jgi:hypothetical protein
MKHCYSLLLLVIALLGSAQPTRASSLTYVTSAPLSGTDWTVTLTLPRFDPANGVLQSVSLEVRDSLVAKFEVENLASSSSSVRDSATVTVALCRPDNSVLLATVSSREFAATLPAYDGTQDYAGTSGATVAGQVAYTTANGSTSALADLTLFKGTGTIGLPCKATARPATWSSSGSAAHVVTARAAAYVVVTYVFAAVVETRAVSWGEVKSLYQ